MPPSVIDLQEQCALGQQQLMRTEYLEAEATLAAAELDALAASDFDTLARLYMPLQEARRQIRQTCGEGVVRLDLVAQSPDEALDAERIVREIGHGQLLVAGWGSIAPAVEVRRLARKRQLYLEVFLGIVLATSSEPLVAILPFEDFRLNDAAPRGIEQWQSILPAGSVLLQISELPRGAREGNTATFAEVSAIWERLHAPFLAAADREEDLLKRLAGYRRTIEVDYACELAHQRASAVAHQLARRGGRASS